jgi:hypothetical protein
VTPVAMLLSMKTLHDKRAGFVNLTMNEYFVMPFSWSIQVKLTFPQEMKEGMKTLKNIQKWDSLIKKRREELKKENHQARQPDH